MELNITAEERREYSRFLRSGKTQKAAASNVLEAIAQFSGGEVVVTEDGRRRMKIVVKKEDVKQVLEAIRDGRSCRRRAPPSCVPLEQRLNLMRRRQLLRAASQVKSRSRSSWRPALQSIPEEEL